MKTTVIVLLVISVGVLGGLLYSQTLALRKQRRQVQELSAKLNSVSEKVDLGLQAACSKQALAVWKSGGWDRKKTATYSSHYNERLKKCFMRIETFREESGAVLTIETVMDAFEAKGYAEFIWKADQKTGTAEAMRCSAIDSSGQPITCTSPEEFDALVRQYMEQ